MSVRPAKTEISLGIRPVWSESSLSAWRKLGSLATHWAHSEDSDQTGRMPRLIWVFAGRTVTLLVLSCRSSYLLSINEQTRRKLFALTGACGGIGYPRHPTAQKNGMFAVNIKSLQRFRMHVRLACRRSRVRSSGPSTFFRGDCSWNHFYGHSLPTADTSRAVVSYWRKDVH